MVCNVVESMLSGSVVPVCGWLVGLVRVGSVVGIVVSAGLGGLLVSQPALGCCIVGVGPGSDIVLVLVKCVWQTCWLIVLVLPVVVV